MLVVLDTNHFTEFIDASALRSLLMSRIDECEAQVFSYIGLADR